MLWAEVQNRWHALWQIDRLIKNKKTDKEKKMRNDYGIRPRAKMKKGGKAKNGTSFGMLSVKAGVDNNPNPTAADRIAGAKKKAKFGKKMQYGGEAASMVPKGAKKMKHGGTVSMQLGSYDRQIGKNYTGKATKAIGLTKAMYGKTMMKKGGKCKNGC